SSLSSPSLFIVAVLSLRRSSRKQPPCRSPCINSSSCRPPRSSNPVSLSSVVPSSTPPCNCHSLSSNGASDGDTQLNQGNDEDMVSGSSSKQSYNFQASNVNPKREKYLRYRTRLNAADWGVVQWIKIRFGG
ncbi:hypothetical protein S83_013584, partial [Arachis hypogaea]